MLKPCALSESQWGLLQRFDQSALTRSRLAGELCCAFEIQLQPTAVIEITGHICVGCQMLVFGCGRDSYVWAYLARRRGGTAYFIEDDPAWISEGLEVVRVSYPTRLKNWKRDVADPELPVAQFMQQFTELQGRLWDLILVDGPAGYNWSKPGRTLSVASAAALTSPRTVVYLDDCDRPPEQAFVERWFPGRPLQITKRFWRLRKV